MIIVTASAGNVLAGLLAQCSTCKVQCCALEPPLTFVCVSCRRSQLLSAVIAGYLLKVHISIRPALREHVMARLLVRQMCLTNCLRTNNICFCLDAIFEVVDRLWFWTHTWIHRQKGAKNFLQLHRAMLLILSEIFFTAKYGTIT